MCGCMYTHICVRVLCVYRPTHTHTRAVLYQDLDTVLFLKQSDKEGGCFSDETVTSCPNFYGNFGDSTEH